MQAQSRITRTAKTQFATLDGNEAVARVAYALNEVIAIYPITPASPMGEWADAWAAAEQPNRWGSVPSIVEMQSEGGVTGAVHGALQTGSLTTTFTASLASHIPFIHFFDGFRTSHEIQKNELLSMETLRSLIDDDSIEQHRQRSLSPDHPVIRGTAQNPDVFFQAREAVNPYYNNCADILEQIMTRFAQLTGRQYSAFDYCGSPTAERAVVSMGSGCETAEETVNALNVSGENVGAVKVRLYRPFDCQYGWPTVEGNAQGCRG